MARLLNAGVCLIMSCCAAAAAQDCSGLLLDASSFRGLDHYGRTASIDGDVLAVGASQHDGAFRDSGAVFVYERIGGDWLETAILEAGDADETDRFGQAVCVSAGRVAVGAFWDDEKGANAGAAYVFAKIGGRWEEICKLTASDGLAGDRFGTSVDMQGDLLVVGAPGSDRVLDGAGAAYVFRFDGNAWVQTAVIDPSDPGQGDAFGDAVKTDDERILIGAYLDDERGTDSGSATVYEYQAGAWMEQAKIVPADGQGSDWFGFNQVAIDGDRLAIGALGDDDRNTNSGAVYVYRLDGFAWTLEQKLRPPELKQLDNFGKSLALDDGLLLVGARFDDRVAWNTGAAYLFERVGLQWRQRSVMFEPQISIGAEYGRGIAINAGTGVVGAHKYSRTGASEAGGAWVYDLGDCAACPADCDQSTGIGVLDIFDFLCFQSAFVASDPYACDCDASSGAAVCDVFDFLCYQNLFVGGCP